MGSGGRPDMTTLRITVLMKTDVCESTIRFRSLERADLDTLVNEHREFISRHAAAQGGGILRLEGDGLWLTYPSVTAAALSARAMQEELRLGQANKADDRLAIRCAITLGDVLHQPDEFVGDAATLAARIEAVTPPDEIYLSAAACLAVNQAEIRTAPVDSFTLKGFPEPVMVYRVLQTHRTRVIADQYILWTDLRGFGAVTANEPVTTTERILDALFELTHQVAREFTGVVRFNAGDAFCLTFLRAEQAMAAADRLVTAWDALVRREAFGCPIVAAVHQGIVYA